MTLTWILSWAASVPLAIFLLVLWWRRDLPVRRDDFVVIALVSFIAGPIAVAVGVGLCVSAVIGDHLPDHWGDEIVFPRKDDRP